MKNSHEDTKRVALGAKLVPTFAVRSVDFVGLVSYSDLVDFTVNLDGFLRGLAQEPMHENHHEHKAEQGIANPLATRNAVG